MKLLTSDDLHLTLEQAKHLYYVVSMSKLTGMSLDPSTTKDVIFYMCDLSHTGALDREQFRRFLGGAGIALTERQFETFWGLNYGRPLTYDMIRDVLSKLFDLL